HHEAGAAPRDVRDNRRSAMDLGDDAEIDGEREVNRGTLLQSEVFGFDEHAVRAQIACSAQLAGTPGNSDVDRRARTMTCVKAPLHLQPLSSAYSRSLT